MKLVMAVIKPFKLDEVRETLTAAGIAGMTVSEVRGYGRQQRHGDSTLGADHAMVPRVKIEVVVEDAQVASVIEAIQAAARTGAVGDGRIFVAGVAAAVRIRTGETNEAAL